MTVAKIEGRILRKGLLIWTLLFTAILVGFTAIYPQMHDSAMQDALNATLQGLSPELLKTFNISVSGPTSFLVATGFFAYYFQYLFLAAAVYAMLLGSQSLIKEETDGTIEFLYAQPLTRRAIVAGKLVANTVILAIFWAVSYVVSLGATIAFQQTGDTTSAIAQGLTRVFLQDGLLLFFFLCLGFFLSTKLTSSKQATGVSLGIVFGFYLIGIFSDLNEQFSWARYFSPIHMGIPSRLLAENLSFMNIVSLIGVSMILLLVSFYSYQRKDLLV